MKSVALHTLGCKLNFSETSTIAKAFQQKGFAIKEFNEKADIYVINTCTVTENADKECRKIIRRAKRINPNAVIAVTGCFAQTDYAMLSKMEEVTIVAGTKEKFKVPELAIESLENNLPSCVYVSPREQIDNFNFASSTDADSRTRAFFKIQDGCDYLCTFCKIPQARGESRSVNPEYLQEKFNEILTEGYKEIILTGVNVGDYGRKIKSSLYELLLKFLETNGDYRIRISSIEPNLLTDEIIQLAKNDDRLAKHFHIPLQSGSDKILRLMKRRYNSKFFESLINKLNDEIPEIGLGIDVITGFPGETDEDFEQTYLLLERLPISYLHVFTYSERPNTEALNFPGKVPFEIRKERTNRLRKLSETKRAEFHTKKLGQNVKVIFEHTNYDGMMKGFSSEYIRVKTKYDKALVNKFVNVKITECDNEECYGEVD